MLESFLHAKPLFYEEIDYTRMPRIYKTLKERLKIPKIIHIIGTNGKGTTGRFLATVLHNLSYNVGHYTSPHILEFNERIWMNGACVSETRLNEVHYELLELLSQEDAEALSYFEYTTFLAILVYQDMDYIVLEAGLGGEFDATAVFPKVLTLVTPIDLDHEAFLGSSIKEIATTKLHAIENFALIAKQKHNLVYDIAEKMQESRAISVQRVEELLDANDFLKIEEITRNNKLVPYLQENLKLAISALKFLEIVYREEDFRDAKLYGRLTQIRENILLDVGHNTFAATAIVESLKGFKYTLVYNSYKDKNYKEILTILKPIIEEVQIIAITDERGESLVLMQETLEYLGIKSSLFQEIQEEKSYLVFGSFSVAEAFLREIDE